MSMGVPGPAERAPRLAILGCRGIPARYGGFETFAEELGARAARAGVEVTVFCPRPRGARELPAEHRGVRLEYVSAPALGPATALVYDLVSLRRARAFDVVYMLGYGAGAFLGLARRPGNEVWVNMDGLEWRRSKWSAPARLFLRSMERAAVRTAQRLVFDSEAVRRVVLDGRDDPRACVIEYGADTGIDHDPGVCEALGLRSGTYALLVARIEPENHVLEILRAHARATPHVNLVVVGDVERAGRYGRRCRLAAAPGARFIGSVYDRPTLYSLRHDAALVLHGHSVGGTNPALLEAMAAGAPIAAHDNPFNREVLGEGGRYFADEDALARLLPDALALGLAERERERAALRARIDERYTWDRIAACYLDLLLPGGTAGGSRGSEASTAGPAPRAPLPGRSRGAPVAREESG